MDIIALPAIPLSGAAAPAAPAPSPAAAGTGGGFARSLEQAAGAVLSPQARPLRTDIAETPAAPPVATQAPTLPGLPRTGMTPLPGGQSEPLPRAPALPMDIPADVAARFPQPPLPPRQTATNAAAPAFPDASVSDDLRRIRSLLQTIESAGQLPPPGAAEAALLSQPPQTSPLPLPLTAATTPASARQSPNQITFASVKPEQNEPTLSTLPRAVGQPELFSNEWTRPAPSEGPRMSEGLQPTIGTSPSDGAALPLVSANPSAGSLAATSNSSTAGSFASTSLTAPLASPDWQRGLSQHLIGLQQRGEQEIELHLHPTELGPLSISLKLGESGAQAQFLSAHPQVRAAVEQAIPQLREALAEQGITLGETSVGERQQQPRDEHPGTPERNRALAGGAGEEATPGRAEAVAPARLRLDGVDLYA